MKISFHSKYLNDMIKTVHRFSMDEFYRIFQKDINSFVDKWSDLETKKNVLEGHINAVRAFETFLSFLKHDFFLSATYPGSYIRFHSMKNIDHNVN